MPNSCFTVSAASLKGFSILSSDGEWLQKKWNRFKRAGIRGIAWSQCMFTLTGMFAKSCFIDGVGASWRDTS